MKKVFLIMAAVCLSNVAIAQDVKTYSVYDSNQSGDVNVADATNVIDKVKENVSASNTQQYVTADDLSELITTLIAKIDKLENNQKLLKQKLGLDPDEEYVEPDPNLLTGTFSVSASKQVQFTKSNLYWDGSAFKFEENQTDYQTTYDANHVSHFYWTNRPDYNSGTADYMPYTENFSCSGQSTADKFWCGEENPLTVEGTSDLYALTGGKSGEWYYLINNRTNASNLYKYGVTVTNGDTSYENCLIIAPDDYDYTTTPLASRYTLEELNAAGLVCLPATGYRNGSEFTYVGNYGYCWTSTADYSSSNQAYFLFYYSTYINAAYMGNRSYARSLRLVHTL